MRTATTTLRGQPSSVPSARRWVVSTLADWGLAATGWTAAQVVSELATNATLHARSDFTLRLAHDGDCVRLEVEDASPAALHARTYSPTSTTGRGLGIVAVLSVDWGVVGHDDERGAGKTVWVLLPVDDADEVPPDDASQERRSSSGGAAGPAGPPSGVPSARAALAGRGNAA